MFRVVVGHSDEFDTNDAVNEVLAFCEKELGEDKPVAGLIYCGSEFEHSMMLRKIVDAFPGIALVGCTTDGEMSSTSGFTEDSINLTLFCSDTIGIAAGMGSDVAEDPQGAATATIDMAQGELEQKPKLVIAMPDGLTSDAGAILEGFHSVLDPGIPVVGGMSADRVGGDKSTYSTHQFYGDQVLTNAVVALCFSGPFEYSLGLESGWVPLGKRMTVTASEGNVLHELDNQPALDLFIHYLGDAMQQNLSGLGSYPLAIYEDGADLFYLRVARDADPETGHVTFLGSIPNGAQVQLTQAVRDQVIDGVAKSAQAALEGYRGSSPRVAMVFSCTGRKVVLGTKTKEEVTNVRDVLNVDIPLCGFYTFGEIGPVSAATESRYHNTTFVTVIMGEA